MSSADLVPAETILAQNAEVIRALGKRVIGDIIEIGRRLTEAKQVAGHGNWLPWLDREFGWTEQTALNFMRVHELASKSKKFLDLSLPVSGLYMLAAPSTPEEARDQVIARAEGGERLSVKDVRNLIEEAHKKQETETAERLAAREAQIRAEYVRGSIRKPPPEPVTERSYYLQFLRTKCHPVTEAVRLMNAEEFAGLVKSIKAHGQHDPIALVEHEGEWVILDGRCREIACGIASVEPKYRNIEVDDPREYFIDVNILRVHLNRDQQVMRKAILTEPDADEEAYDPDQPPPPIVAARYVLARCPPYVDAVIKGAMSLSDAYNRTVDDAWRVQHGGSVDLDWLKTSHLLKEDAGDY